MFSFTTRTLLDVKKKVMNVVEITAATDTGI